MSEKAVQTPEQIQYAERLKRVKDAIALKEPDRVPVAPFFDGVMQRLYGSCYRNIYYDYKTAGEAVLKFYSDYPLCDAHYFNGFTSGTACELAGCTMIDWPGRPGTTISEHSTHQVIENEYLLPEEYHEFLDDYTGFMIRKYIPRAYKNLKGFAGVAFTPTIVLSTTFLSPLYSPEMLEMYKILAQIAEQNAAAGALTLEYQEKLAAMGLPPMFTGVSQAPFDILGDYFRGTIGIMEDLFEYEDEIEKACDLFAEQQIAALSSFKDAPMPIKRVFFPLHKGMDGFMSPRQYEKLYWKPLRKIIMALIDMGVTPYIYTEGRYDTRLEYLADVPKGKVVYHFENVDMKRAKEIVGPAACITGNLSPTLLEFGKKEDVAEACKALLDTCAPGGGYIFDTSAVVENAKPENLEAMFETLEKYGKY